MDQKTLLALNAINREFYARSAGEFSASRRHDWPGFERVLACVKQRAPSAAPLRVLDLGTGDGRFAAYLRSFWSGAIDFIGIDASPELLARAAQRELGSAFRFQQSDFIETPPSAALPQGPFDLIAVLGVLHHVPGRQTRRALLDELGRRVSERGVLVLTFWRLPEDPRFQTHTLPWTQLANSIASEQLESGDTLLRWGTNEGPARYCHFADAAETDELLAATGLSVVDRFRSDGRGGRLNEYALLSR